MSESVTVLLFSVLRERLGWHEKEIPWREGMSPQTLWEELIEGDRGGVAPAIDHTFVPWSAPIKPGDEIAFVPPVAGG